MFVKVYQYHIQKDKVEEYLDIQEKAAIIYSKYLDTHTIFLNSIEDESKWIEITKYRDEAEYKKWIKIINEQIEIQELFKSFQSLLVLDKDSIIEENFLEVKEIRGFF